jgi:DNA end-binding protein Ku
MHFPDELRNLSDFKIPSAKSGSKAELNMATKLIESMTSDWDPKMYHDDYHEALEKLIEEKVAHPDKKLPTPRKTKSTTSAIDLVSVLQRSIQQTQNRSTAKLLKSKPNSRNGHNGKVHHRVK